MNPKREQDFKIKCERFAREITKKTDIIFTDIRYKETLHDVFEIEKGVLNHGNPSERQMSCSKIKFGFKNRIEVTFVGCGVGAQNLTPARRNAINRILKTNAKVTKDSPTQAHQITITFNVNPHKM